MNRSLLFILLWAALPAGGNVLQLTWMHSGRAAASLDVQLDDGSILRSSADGTVEVTSAKTIRIRDPKSGLQLLERTLHGETAIQVPEPIRIRGRARRVSGRLTAKVGDGPRGEAARRMQHELGSLIARSSAPSPLGIPLRETPLRWTLATIEERQFTSGWIAASPSPEVMLFDEGGNSAVSEFSIPPTVRPWTTIEAGTIALEPSAILEVTIPTTAGNTAPSMELYVQRGTIADKVAAARELPLLDQRDRRLFALLAAGDPYYLPANERTRLLMPRWLKDATLVLRDSYTETRMERNVSLTPGKISRADLRGTETGAVRRSASLGGVVLSGDSGQAVPNATVVVADGTRRRETKTDAAGKFQVDGVTAPAPVALFVDSGDASDRQTAAFHVLPARDLTLKLPNAQKVISLPRLNASVSSFQDCNVKDDQYPIVVPTKAPPDVKDYDYSLDFNAGTMTFISDTTGNYKFNVYATPFLLLQAEFTIPAGQKRTEPLQYEPYKNITFLIQTNQRFDLPKGQEVSFSPAPELAPWLDATEIDLDSNSKLWVPCVNINPLSIYIDDGHGRGCDGPLSIEDISCTIFLPEDPTQPCECVSNSRRD